MDIVTSWWISFLAGLFTPLGSVCVLPLYPGFLAFLAGRLAPGHSKWTVISLAAIVAGGVLLSMLAFGFLYVTFIYASLGEVIHVVSIAAFSFLAAISILLIIDIDPGMVLPGLHLPNIKNPILAAFLFGFFFGIIILPCNAASIVLLLALSTTAAGYVANLLNFLFFGIGMALPLLLLCAISIPHSTRLVNILTAHKRTIHLLTGIIMFVISLYYIIFLLNNSLI
ncbi:MAG TPA: cytochrome c biogenesis protein CcdA [Methanoregulaceae archaeon]|nr:cytochrome c biogenesis protein CcdA [Methanoregulaceae archaeon]